MANGFLFSGQGAQRVGMGLSLYENSARVRDLYAEADDTLGYALTKICFEGPEEDLTQTKICQPALFVHGMALFTLLRERELVEPMGACLGLSLGELTALTAAGAFDFSTGLKVVAERGRLMQEACEATLGGMASLIGGEEQAVRDLCQEFDVDLANLNCPGQIVVSGAQASVDALVEAAKASGAYRMVVPLKVAGAYHSRLMESAREVFSAYLGNVHIETPQVPVFTNTTGEQVSDPNAIRRALALQVVSSVQWEACFRNAVALGIDAFYECGPGAVLAGLARRIDKQARVTSLSEWSDLPAA